MANDIFISICGDLSSMTVGGGGGWTVLVFTILLCVHLSTRTLKNHNITYIIIIIIVVMPQRVKLLYYGYNTFIWL